MAATTSSQGNQLPRPWNPSFGHADRERWVCIYPAYINAKKTLAEGRKIPKEKGVDNPTYVEMRDVLSAGSFTIGVENKVYSREKDPKEIRYRGRIRIHLKNDEGAPVNPEFPTRRSIMLHLAEMIPKLKSRQQQQQSTHSQSQQPTSKKKKGKK